MLTWLHNLKGDTYTSNESNSKDKEEIEYLKKKVQEFEEKNNVIK